MHTDSRGFAPIDPGRVNSMDPVELDYWAECMDCSREDLVAAIGEVGEHVTEIRDALRRRGLHPH